MPEPLSFHVKSKKGFAHLVEFIYALGQYLTIRFLPDKAPGKIGSLFFRFPLFLYRVGFGGLVGSKVLLITTIGRKSGQNRTTPLGYIAGKENAFYIIAGWKGSSNWYKNVKTNPEVQVLVGSRKFNCRAEELSVEDQVKVLTNFSKLYPIVLRTYELATRISFDGTDELFRRMVIEGPMLVLREFNQK